MTSSAPQLAAEHNSGGNQAKQEGRQQSVLHLSPAMKSCHLSSPMAAWLVGCTHTDATRLPHTCSDGVAQVLPLEFVP